MKLTEEYAPCSVTDVKTYYWIFELERCLFLFKNMEARCVNGHLKPSYRSA